MVLSVFLFFIYFYESFRVKLVPLHLYVLWFLFYLAISREGKEFVITGYLILLCSVWYWVLEFAGGFLWRFYFIGCFSFSVFYA